MSQTRNAALAAAVLTALWSAPSEAATVILNSSDYVTAIQNLDVGGMLYNVTIGVYDTLALYGDPPSNFDLPGMASAGIDAIVAALNAEGGVLGAGTFGDGSIYVGDSYTSGDTMNSYRAGLGTVWANDGLQPTALRGNYTYAVFEKIVDAPPVPLPASGWLLVAALSAGAALRQRRT